MLIPILYLKGISTGDFEDALAALLGKDAGGLSASTIARLKEAWVDEHARWRDRDLSAKRYVYVWADGIYVQARLEDDALQRARHVAHLLRNFIHLFSTPLPAVFVYGPFDALGDELGERPDIHLDARAFKRLHIRRA